MGPREPLSLSPPASPASPTSPHLVTTVDLGFLGVQWYWHLAGHEDMWLSGDEELSLERTLQDPNLQVGLVADLC